MACDSLFAILKISRIRTLLQSQTTKQWLKRSTVVLLTTMKCRCVEELVLFAYCLFIYWRKKSLLKVIFCTFLCFKLKLSSIYTLQCIACGLVGLFWTSKLIHWVWQNHGERRVMNKSQNQKCIIVQTSRQGNVCFFFPLCKKSILEVPLLA